MDIEDIDEPPTDIPETESVYNLYLWHEFRIKLKMSQLQSLREYLEENHIEYERLR